VKASLSKAAFNSSADLAIADLIEEWTARLQSGEPFDVEACLLDHPEHADRLRKLLPALQMLDALSGSGGPELSSSSERESPLAHSTLGDFRIIREVGRGGMGVVYEAQQLSLGRRVALKVLPFAATMDPRQLQRFHNEARAAAGLHHTNIVPVFGVGQERGVHFYAMQYIEGRTLAEFIAEQSSPGLSKSITEVRAAPGSAPTVPAAAQPTSAAPRDAAYFRRVADWGIQAAEALDCAHELGVVHRDIKPANLLIGAGGRLWITDFGLAQVQSDARLTITGDLVGTLRYMSPEQALAKRVVIDHRTDVYSLGATLYELLTLQPVFDGADRQELLRQIAFEDPKPPRRINKAIPPELETVVLKALEKNPQDRYATAKELANDLRNWQQDRPIQARRPGIIQRSRKWARRHKPAVWAAVAILLIGAGLSGATEFWWTQKRTGAEVAARAALDEATRLGQEERWREAMSATKRARVVLAGVGADPDLWQLVEELDKDLEMGRKLQDASLQREPRKDWRIDYGVADSAYADAFRWYGLEIDGLGAEEVANRIRSRSIRVQLVAALDDWSSVRRARNKNWRPMLAAARRADSDAWRNQLRDAFERNDSGAVEKLLDSVRSNDLSPSTAVLLSRLAGGPDQLKRAVELLEKVRLTHPADFGLNLELARRLCNMTPPRSEKAIRFLTAAVALRPESVGARLNLGVALAGCGRLDDAVQELRAAIAQDPEYAAAHYNLGTFLRDQERLDEAVVELRAAIAIDPKFAMAHVNLGEILQLKGKKDEACREFKVAIASDPKLAMAHNNLGSCFWADGRIDEAIVEYRAAVALDSEDALAPFNLAGALSAKGQHDEAIPLYRAAIAIDSKFAEAYCNLASELGKAGKFEESLENYREGHAIGIKRGDWKYPSAQWLQQAEFLVQMDKAFTGILAGKKGPEEAEKRVMLAEFCLLRKKRHATAARLYADAFADNPQLAELGTSHRYNAACASALAGCGQGQDAAKLDDMERGRLRKQALDWLVADLAEWSKLAKMPSQRDRVLKTLQHWQQDTDFAGVRGPESLGRLPEAERQAWRQLWADVAETLGQARDRSAGEKKAPKNQPPG
jgi:serine/threonine protein kinase/Tfp pilus assembly protein PilF